MKVLSIDGRSPLDSKMDVIGYPLSVALSVSGDESALAAFMAQPNVHFTNREPRRMTRVAMTGVTALVRATAYEMEQNGILYPGEEVAPILRSADIAHISNEVSFVADCPYPNPVGGTSFCSADRYFDLLVDFGH